MNSEQYICPKCGSRNIQAGKRGFNTRRAIAGGLLTDNWLMAIAAGGIGANKTELTCLHCGHTFDIKDSVTVLPTRADLNNKYSQQNTGCLGIIIPLVIVSLFLFILIAIIV